MHDWDLDFLRLVLDTHDFGVFLYDTANHRVLVTNPIADDFLGSLAGDLQGAWMHKRVMAARRDALALRVTTPDGQIYGMSVRPMLRDDKKVIVKVMPFSRRVAAS
jgi:hypothetical protein